MDAQTSRPFAHLAETVLADAATSLEQSTKASNGSDDAHKRAFLEMFRRWEILFKRKDSDAQSAKWLIAEYYSSLSHLSEEGLRKLTDILKENCIFFPTIKECLDATRAGYYDWGHPFRGGPEKLFRRTAPTPHLYAPAERITYVE